MKLIKKIQKSTSDVACFLFEENRLFFALSETKEALIDQFKCKMQPIECCISTIGDQHINGCYVAEVDVNQILIGHKKAFEIFEGFFVWRNLFR